MDTLFFFFLQHTDKVAPCRWHYSGIFFFFFGCVSVCVCVFSRTNQRLAKARVQWL
jgi:hypothetical protein